MTGAESATFTNKRAAKAYGKGNFKRYRVSGPRKDEYSGQRYFVVSGVTKDPEKRKYCDHKPFDSKVRKC